MKTYRIDEVEGQVYMYDRMEDKYLFLAKLNTFTQAERVALYDGSYVAKVNVQLYI